MEVGRVLTRESRVVSKSCERKARGFGQRLMSIVGALPLAEHLTARKAKWGIKLLFGSTSTPWIRLAWTLIHPWSTSIPPLLPYLLHVRVCRSDPITNPLTLTHGLPYPLRRLLLAVETLPTPGRLLLTGYTTTSWFPLTALLLWRSNYTTQYCGALLALGSPAWPNPRSLHFPHKAIPTQAYSVQLGTRLLTTEALNLRS